MSDETAIKYMTDGILIQEINVDFSLKKYSVIVIDEAHERSLNSDILLGMVSRIVRVRRKMFNDHKMMSPLKLIIMSATLQTEKLINSHNLFDVIPPVINIPSRQYDITIHFNEKTEEDYIDAAYKKICRIHRDLPSGGILVFLTGKNEIKYLCNKLKKKYNCKNTSSSQQITSLNDSKESEVIKITDSDDKAAVNHDNEDRTNEKGDSHKIKIKYIKVLPLYAMLPRKQQQKVFEFVPDDTRLIVIATNVAETSITIPNIKYVVDTGRSKQKSLDPQTGISTYEIK